MAYFDAFANKLPSTVHLRYLSADLHLDVILKSFELHAFRLSKMLGTFLMQNL
jgi:hypothetical protein